MTNFIVSDFWRWLVVHMWVEVTFVICITVIIAYMFRVLMPDGFEAPCTGAARRILDFNAVL